MFTTNNGTIKESINDIIKMIEIVNGSDTSFTISDLANNKCEAKKLMKLYKN